MTDKNANIEFVLLRARSLNAFSDFDLQLCILHFPYESPAHG